jgi:hypothetical protein
MAIWRILFDADTIMEQGGGEEYFRVAAFRLLNCSSIFPYARNVGQIMRAVGFCLQGVRQKLFCQCIEGREWLECHVRLSKRTQLMGVPIPAIRQFCEALRKTIQL